MSGACNAGPKGAWRSRDRRGWSAGAATSNRPQAAHVSYKMKANKLNLIASALLLLFLGATVHAAGDLPKGGTFVGRVQDNGSIVIRGTTVGRFETNGDIRIKGSVVGRIESNGSIRKRGTVEGRVKSNGDVRKRGTFIGRIEDDGNVREKGTVIGSAKGVAPTRAAALFFFGVVDL
ncbi:MAG: polymer-forming cytoskeletal protein [Planctomycetaceae bacterium]